MFGLNRVNPFDEIFSFQRELDRVFNQFWTDLPGRTAGLSQSFQVDATDNEWRVDVPLPGIDPANVNLEVSGNTISIRAEEPADRGTDKKDRKEKKDNSTMRRYEQTFTVPQFLDADNIDDSYQHGMLRLTLPVKESVKPRRIAIGTTGEPAKQMTGTAA